MPSSLFGSLEMAPRDPILGITEAFNADQNPRKVNLGAGVYNDDTGKLPLLECVKRVEKEMTAKAAARGYLPIDGLAAYDKAAQALVFGADSEPVRSGAGRHDTGTGRDRRAEGRRRLSAAAAARRRSLDQRSELGKSPGAVRTRRIPGQQLPLL